ncbi:type III secretion system inner rod subunit SctI [Paludibacterium yongneupense]|uniref:type III secretion system inner rod subunit SctI n=1 Tax=Paludibacterium yongneupense TaxID=400061 RepID=UPI0003F87BE7|nr:type III secretion system inner rod subunit SctI [Paludibacterium yongneupense]
MPIVPVAALASASSTSAPTVAAAPSPTAVAAFEQTLFGSGAVVPERALAGVVHDLAVSTRSPVGAGALLDSPERMLSAQSALHRTLLDVEVTARVAGAIGQAINKLVSLQ